MLRVGSLSVALVLAACSKGNGPAGSTTSTATASTPVTTAANATTPAVSAVGSSPAASSSAAPVASPSTAVATLPGGSACEQAPKGMACIVAGPAVIGTSGGAEAEKPQHTVTVSTFYLDKYEVTTEQYDACSATAACPKPQVRYAGFDGKQQPMVAVQWHMAQAYCRWVGKRLPTEAEWEKAARGGAEGHTYPWGNEAPTCERAQYKGCEPATTLPVGSKPVGAYGIFDLAGNGYEWVQDFSTPCYRGCVKECGEHCEGEDPIGPCGGLIPCDGQYRHVLKGGSWYWPAKEIRGAHRRGEIPESGEHRFSFRCASDSPFGHGSKRVEPLAITEPLAKRELPKAPTEAELRLALAVPDDADVLKIPPCGSIGTATKDCHDPFSYVTSNERFLQRVETYIKDLGGGYLGVGSDQNYALIAAAKSQWVWLMDYDPSVSRMHFILRALIGEAADPAAFVALWTPENRGKSVELITKSLEQHHVEGEKDLTVKLFHHVASNMLKYYKLVAEAEKDTSASFGWLHAADAYTYIRLLYAQGRIVIRKGNLLTDKVLPAVAKSARALGVPIHVYYTSNAEEMWDLYDSYRENIKGLPFEERSVSIRTLSFAEYKDPKHWTDWNYVVHASLDFQRHLRRRGAKSVRDFMVERSVVEKASVSLIRLPSRLELE